MALSMALMPIVLQCAGCGAEVSIGARGVPPYRCAAARGGDDVDHVLRRTIDASRLSWPDGGEANPFLRYRRLLLSWHVATANGMTDAEFRTLVTATDEAVGLADGRRFVETPFRRERALARGLGFDPSGGVWVKDETGNVSGSHKGRHLMGILLCLEVADRIVGAPRESPRLAIASCGNAALAAAVLARAAGRPLRVFVPPAADPFVLSRLSDLGAESVLCDRRAGEAGDPCYLRFRGDLAAGSFPFCCQGNENGLTVEGGETLAWEIVDALDGAPLDRLFIQVGGGALASACVQALSEAAALGRRTALPRIHAVQTSGGHPLVRAYDRLAARIGGRLFPGRPSEGREQLAGMLAEDAARAAVAEELRFARAHRSLFMWPWETEPRSIASGILDDETYDWAVVVEGMLQTGGWPIVVDEGTLARANDAARTTTGVDVDHTGSAGLAGLIALRQSGALAPHEQAAVVFSGARRPPVS